MNTVRRMIVKRWDFVPPGGEWWFIEPRTKVRIVGMHRPDIMAKAHKHYVANNLPVGLEFESQIEDLVCQAMPNCCIDANVPQIRIARLGLQDIVHGTRTMIAHDLAGKPVVDDAEANRRAAICAQCPMRVPFLKPCTGCGALLEFVKDRVGNRRTQSHNAIANLACYVCHCFLEAAVWVPLDIQCKAVTPQQRGYFARIENCWKQCGG